MILTWRLTRSEHPQNRDYKALDCAQALDVPGSLSSAR